MYDISNDLIWICQLWISVWKSISRGWSQPSGKDINEDAWIPHWSRVCYPVPILDSSFLLTQTLVRGSDSSSNWVPTNYVQDQDWIPGSRSNTWLSQAFGEWSRGWKALLSSSLSKVNLKIIFKKGCLQFSNSNLKTPCHFYWSIKTGLHLKKELSINS